MKYIMFEDGSQLPHPVLFSDLIDHSTMSEMVQSKKAYLNPVSAGKVNQDDAGEIYAGGSSFTLDLKSRKEDTEVIRRSLSPYF